MPAQRHYQPGYFLLPLCTCCLLSASILTSAQTIEPLYITERVKYDTDDPAIWINPHNPAASLIIGTDKEKNGALYVFNMQGKVIEEKVVRGLQHPNNVDVAYGLLLNGKKVDIAVTTERLTSKLRIFSMPDMKSVDGGGIDVFKGEARPSRNAPMGIALYERPADKKIFAIVSRKNGPKDGTYLWQYELYDNGNGEVKATLVRKFGAFSGRQEIEAIAVDDELGYVYYSDEKEGVRKYYADPEKGNEQLALFANRGFASEQEGISIYKTGKGTGYILVSDQQANRFHIFTREGAGSNPHQHQLVKVVRTATRFSDGSEVTSVPILPDFPKGVFVAMSENETFHLYRWEDLIGEPDATPPPPVTQDPKPAGPLVGHWQMDEQWGSLLQDATENQNEASLRGSPKRTEGKSGQAIFLNGNNQYAIAPSTPSLNITDAITLAAWIMPAKKGTQYIIKKAIHGSTDGYELSLSSSGQAFFRINEATSDNAYRLNSKIHYPTDGETWVHLAATFDGETMKLYINGHENNTYLLTEPQRINSNNKALAIGAQSDGNSEFKGSIDDVRIYNTALSSRQVRELAKPAANNRSTVGTKESKPITATPQNLQAWPNPFTTTTIIHFVANETGRYTLLLQDNKGALVKLIQQGNAAAGQNIKVPVDGTALSKGIYIVKLKTGNKEHSIKLLLVQ